MSDADDILNELRGQFLHLTTVRLQRIEQLLRTLAAQSDDLLLTAGLEELRREFHSLAGSGKTFGYANATTLSRQAEALCDDLLSRKQSPSPDDLITWREILAAIKAEIFPAAKS